jgi:GT2 family glycosyltransferase
MRITALLTCHNRRESTLASLGSFFSQSIAGEVDLDAVLVDDGSSDGTRVAVATAFPNVLVVPGPGDLYWAAGMALAERHALTRDPDHLLWLNDDVSLDPDAIGRMLAVAHTQASQPCIVVGALRDPSTGEVTYSGVRRRGRGLHPLRVEPVQPGDRPIRVETFNGNVVLVSRAVSAVAGPIDGRFAHALADFDYGLRAARLGVRSLLAPGTIGTCARRVPSAPWLDPSLPVRKRFEFLVSPKGFPPHSAARYLRRYGGPAWPIFWVAPYLRQTYFMVRAGMVRSKPVISIIL